MNKTKLRSPQRKIPLKGIFIFLMGFFYLGLLLVYPLPIMSQLIRLAGIGMVALYLIILLSYRPPLAPEIYLFSIFSLWAAITGAFIAQFQFVFMDSISTLIQILALMFAVYGFSRSYGSIKPIFWIILICVSVLDFYVLIGGELSVISLLQSSIRTSSFLKNPNYYAFFNVLGIFALLFLRPIKGKLLKITRFAFLIFFALNILYSSSQKSFLGVIVLFFCWYWFCSRNKVKRGQRIINFLLFSITAFIVIYFTFNFTFLGMRLQNSSVGDDISLTTRLALYQEGWDLFLSSPITGVGIGHFMYYSSMNAYAHSDFLEVLSTTGIIGFFLYGAIYFVLWKRLNSLHRLSINNEFSYQIGLFKAFIITLTFIGLGRPNFNSIETMFVIASLIGYSHYLQTMATKFIVANNQLDKLLRRPI